MNGPLAGVKVLDLSRILAGPWSAQILADFGAEVIKVEQPGRGDDTRGYGPPFLPDSADGTRGDAAYFLGANRGKRSITIDMAKPEGQALIRDLAARADILVENFKVGGLARYGLDYPSLSASNPELIYCSITGFGQTGPYAPRAGYDFLLQAMGGLMSVTGEMDDLPGGGPMKAGAPVVDIQTGLYATIAILGALYHRAQGGGGQHIDLSLFEVQVATLGHQALGYLVGGRPPRRLGNGHPTIVPYRAFRTADGFFVLAVGNDLQFEKFAQAIGRPDLVLDPAFKTNAGRVVERARLEAILEPMMLTRTSDDWMALLEPLSVPCGPINTVDRVFADPQIKARGVEKRLARPDGEIVPSVKNPIEFSRTPIAYDRAPPELGQDTDWVLTEILGMDEAEIARLKRDGVV